MNNYKTDDVNAPVFLCLGNVHNDCYDAKESAKDFGALLIIMETRFSSCSNRLHCPVKNFSPSANLEVFTTKQALDDTANFHDFFTKKHNLTDTNQWVLFGASFNGVIAAYSRSKYPHLFHGAVISSSPIHATVHMGNYNNHIALTYANSEVGGSDECVKVIRDGHEMIRTKLDSSNGRRVLEKRFGLQPMYLESLDARVKFAADGVAQFPAQENDPTCPDAVCNVRKICEVVLKSKGTPLDSLKELRDIQHGKVNDKNRLDGIEDLLWDWEKCKEFGLFQTCEKESECMFTQG